MSGRKKTAVNRRGSANFIVGSSGVQSHFQRPDYVSQMTSTMNSIMEEKMDIPSIALRDFFC